MISILKNLVGFKTTHQLENRKEFPKAFNYISSFLKKSKIPYKIINNKGYLSLIAGRIKNPKIVVLTHLDVVPAKEKLFSPKIIKNKFFGRGVFDMKFAIAVMLEIFKNHPYLKNNVSFIITSDEEIGGKYGAEYLINNLGFKKGKLFIVPDGGENFYLETQAKGVLHLKIITQGKSSHGSTPWLGENAVEKFIKDYEKLKKIIPSPKKETWGLTVNLGKIKGGTVLNQVPDYLETFLDFRYPPEKNKKEILDLVKKVFSKSKIEILTQGDPLIINTKNKYLTLWIKTVKKFLPNYKTKFIRSYGASDARFLTKHKIPAIITGLKGGEYHTENEWIDIDSLKDFYNILKDFLHSLRITCPQCYSVAGGRIKPNYE